MQQHSSFLLLFALLLSSQIAPSSQSASNDPDAIPTLTDLTLSPEEYAALASKNTQENKHMLINILWPALGYIIIGLSAVITEFFKRKNFSISIMFLLFILQGALDIMDVLSDAVAAYQLLSGTGNQCGWTQCHFQDFFHSFGIALLVCVAIGTVLTLIMSILTLIDIMKRICKNKFISTEETNTSHTSHAGHTSDNSMRRDIILILIKLILVDLPVLIIYLRLWDYSWRKAGIGVSLTTAIAFGITLVDIIYALFIIAYKTDKGGFSMDNCGSCPMCLCCCVFVIILVCVAFGLNRMLNKQYEYSVPRLSIGKTCYDPYWGYFGMWTDGWNDKYEYGATMDQLFLVEVDITDPDWSDIYDKERFIFDFFFTSGKDETDPEEVMSFSSFEIWRRPIGKESFSRMNEGPRCDITGIPGSAEYIGNTGGPWSVYFKTTEFKYGCYDTIWDCEGVNYMTRNPVQICLDICQWDD